MTDIKKSATKNEPKKETAGRKVLKNFTKGGALYRKGDSFSGDVGDLAKDGFVK